MRHALPGLLALAVVAACEGEGPGVVPADGSGEVPGDVAGEVEERDASAPEDAPADEGPEVSEPLEAIPEAPAYALVGEEVVLDGSASTGATRYQWSFGDGEGWDAPRSEPRATVTYEEPGRYQAVLTVHDEAGGRRSASTVVAVTLEPRFQPRPSSTVAAIPGTERVAVVSPDSDEVTLVERDGEAFSVVERLDAPGAPATVTPWGEWLLVPCRDASTLRLLRHDGSGEARAVELPYGSRPYGATWHGEAIYVTLAGTGEVARVILDPSGAPQVDEVFDGFEDARGVAALPDGRVAVTRWRSPPDQGEIGVLDPASGEVERWTLAFDPQAASDTEIGGVPTYLDQLLVSPTGAEIALPSLQANVGQGIHRNGEELTFETTIRAVTSFVDPATGAEDFDRRRQFDNRGFASGGVYSSRGDWLFVTTRGSRSVERLDILSGTQSGSILFVGFAPDGVALSPDDRHLYVNASLSRELVVYDVSDFSSPPQALARLPVPSEEPLAPHVLRGKQLFNDSFDTRLAKDGYMACTHCHLDGETDRRTWDFTDRGEGLRDTIDLLGRAGGDGPLHWSANFDEVQDFEHDIREHFRGTGLMEDADFEAEGRDRPLGAPKAGVTEDLDALAAYVESLAAEPRSPHRTADGSLTADAEAGKVIFESEATGCTDCHGGERLTDSRWLAPGEPLLHDVGTLTDASGERLGGSLEGLDTPTLHGLWRTPPYLHDGSAATLHDVLTTANPADAHGVTSDLTEVELDQLVAYLLSLDGRRD